MCGIAGIFRDRAPQAVRAMLAALRHRGPDDEGLYTDDAVTLGHRRLAIIDTSAAGHQPMSAAGGAIQIVYNGELYNFREQRAALEARGRTFRTQSDTEVVLALYQEFGEDFFTRLRGIFALALYDRRGGPGRERLLLARDHFGIKPLLYAETGGALVFASELKAMLASGRVAREVDSDALRQLLSLGSVIQPRTLVSNVSALPSAHYLIADRAGIRLRRYWSYQTDRVPGLRLRPYPEQVEQFAGVIGQSVIGQTIGDVPVGAFLSGGVDSSLIAALMAKEASGQVNTFSVGFEDDPDAVDESHEAAEIAAILGTRHSRVLVGAGEVATHMDRFVQGLDQPSVDGLNSYFVSYAAAQAATVALSGTGGDEVFLGYPWFAEIGRAFGTRPLAGPGRLRRLGSLFGGRPAALAPEDGDGTGLRDAFGRLYHCFGPDLAHGLVAAERRGSLAARSFAEDLAAADELRSGGALERAGVLCLNSYARNQLLRDIDACAMAHSLEVRVPFLDPVVVDFALSLPPSAKMADPSRAAAPGASYQQSGVKRIVCDVARRYLPPEFFTRRAKKGFILPCGDWLRGRLATMLADTLSPATVKQAGLLDPAAVAETLRAFRAGNTHWSRPWLLMIASLWHSEVLTTSPANAPPRRTEPVSLTD
ncbi:MAG TPA: asparagine synthase (glutamine-hydrolyzing) [Stellaceae bacterium]|jgi:asparagine synthase (glutamine-hydrolysing)